MIPIPYVHFPETGYDEHKVYGRTALPSSAVVKSFARALRLLGGLTTAMQAKDFTTAGQMRPTLNLRSHPCGISTLPSQTPEVI